MIVKVHDTWYDQDKFIYFFQASPFRRNDVELNDKLRSSNFGKSVRTFELLTYIIGGIIGIFLIQRFPRVKLAALSMNIMGLSMVILGKSCRNYLSVLVKRT